MADKISWFWNEDVWLPPNVTWPDLKPNDRVKYSDFKDLFLPIPAAFGVILIRYLIERVLFRPLGIFLGLRKSKHKLPPENELLEKYYNKKGGRTKEQRSGEIAALSHKLDMSERRVERWLRMRKLYLKPTTLDKFAETGWRWFYYTGIYIYGIIILWQKSWFWNIRNCWYDYPHHSIDADVWWYYMIELSFYWALCISQFYDTKRKDFWEMFIHHITTILLMALSWTCNLTRVGTLVLIIHDIADIFLEAAKLCKYTNYQKCCDVLFSCFALTWIVTRIGVYPSWILYSTTIEAPQILEMFPAYYIFNGLLSILLILHVIWTYFILKIVYKALYSGKMEKDSRSDSSDTSLSSSNNSQ